MRLLALPASLILATVVVACAGGPPPPPPPPAESPQPTTPLPPTAPASPTPEPRPTPTPLSLSDVAGEFRTFVNETHAYAIQVPTDWQITPPGARLADRIEVAAPGPSQIRGPNIVPPLVFAISALDPGAGYRSLDDVEANRPLGDEILDRVDLGVNGLPARRIHSRDEVYGNSQHFIIQRDGQFFVVDVYGYAQAPIEPILGTFGPPPVLERETVSGRVGQLDARTHTMLVTGETGAGRRVRWFSDTELLPTGRLEGHLDAGDRIVAEGVVVSSDELQATSITLSVPERAGSQAVLEFRQVGGIAGFLDRLVIFSDGTVLLERGEEEVPDARLTEEQWKTVKNFVSILRPFAWHQEDNPGGPDNLMTDLDFYGDGRFEAAFDNQAEVVNHIQEILASLK